MQKNDLIISARGTVGALAQLAKPMTFNQSCYGIRAIESKIDNSYLYYILKNEENQFKSNAAGVTFGAITISTFESIKIPLPPLEIQKLIASECEKVDKEVEEAEKLVLNSKSAIVKSIENTVNKGYKTSKLSEVSLINPSKNEIRGLNEDTIVSFVEMASVSENGYISHKVDRPLNELKKGSYTYFKEDDIIIAKITPCMENGKCAVAKDLTNKIGFGSSEFHVIRTKDSMNTKYVFTFINREVIRKEAEKNMTGASGHRRVPASFYENLQIPVPSLNEQNKLVSEIEKLEQKVIEAEKILNAAKSRKQEVIKKYL